MPNNQKSKDNLALIVGGLFVLTLVFAAYNYFNKGAETDLDDASDAEIVLDKDAVEGDINGDAVTSTAEGVVAATTAESQAVVWVANDYKEGDITGASYIVKSGDTLWEIAEAVYGNGGEWTKILAANAGSVGFLPNGQQSLIVPGQVLVLP